MNLRTLRLPALLLVAVWAVSGCLSSKGSEANAPSGVSVKPGDGRIVVTWAEDTSVDYWVFYAPGTNVSPDNWTTIAGSNVIQMAHSPLVIGGLTNGTVYSVSINGRTNGGPGGPGTPALTATPQLAGQNWALGTTLTGSNLRAVTFSTTTYVVAGDSGALFTSTDGKTWTTVTPVTAQNLYGITYDGGYVAVGAAGTALFSADGITWTAEASGTTNDLNAVTWNHASLTTAVGNAGTIVSTANGSTWTAAATSGTTANLFGVFWANYNGGILVAVGAGGTIVTSTDGSTWTRQTSNTTADLHGITYGTSTTTAGATTFVAVGTGGTVLTSPDAVNWTVRGPLAATTLDAVVFGTQFIATGTGGAIFTSTDGITWTAQTSNTANEIFGIAHGTANADYVAVGAAGTNDYSSN